ncbi:MAG: transcription elongation factor GreA [bacterium]
MDNQLTAEAFQKLKEELEYLKTTKRKEMAEQLNYAIGFGDLSENAAYSEAKEAQGFLEGRILELQGLINTAKIVNYQGIGLKDVIHIGSMVQLKSDRGDMKLKVVYPNEADPMSGKISSDSPLGKALIGKVKGDSVTVAAPNGKIIYKIIHIE